MYDVVVIGGGLAGSIAALRARQRGAKVALARRSWGATALSSGGLDVAYSPALSPAVQTSRTIADHVMDILAHRARHPYGTIGLERTMRGLREGYALLRQALNDAGLEIGTLDLENDNLGLPSSLGAVLPAATALGSHIGLDLARPENRRIGVLQLEGDATFDAKRLALGFAHDGATLSGASPSVEVVHSTMDGQGGAFALAHRFDDVANIDALARDLETKARGLQVLVVPPVLGMRRHTEARRRLAELTGLVIVEAFAHAPSVPGVRLQNALDAALSAARIDSIGEIASPVLDGNRVTSVRTTDALHISASAFVLATGRFISGGVTFTDHCREALFGLPVVTELGLLEDDAPHGVVRESPVESHPLMTAGVAVTPDLSPVLEGRRAAKNLFAAGMVLGGFASRYALCSDGVALATGFWAAEGALGVRA